MSEWIEKEEVLKQIDCWLMTGEYKYSNATHYLDKRISSIKPKEYDWISVKDRLPEPYEDVLVCMYLPFREINKRVVTLSYYLGDDEGYFFEEDAGIEVTHWMPLPEPPEPPEGDT